VSRRDSTEMTYSLWFESCRPDQEITRIFACFPSAFKLNPKHRYDVFRFCANCAAFFHRDAQPMRAAHSRSRCHIPQDEVTAVLCSIDRCY
jgi:hypothetical protein